MTKGVQGRHGVLLLACLSVLFSCKKLATDQNDRSLQDDRSQITDANGQRTDASNLIVQTNQADFGTDEFSSLSIGLSKAEKHAITSAGRADWLLTKLQVDGGSNSCELWEFTMTLASVPSSTATEGSTATNTATTADTGTETTTATSTTESSAADADNFVYLTARRIEKRQDDYVAVIDYLGKENRDEGAAGVAIAAGFKTYGSRDLAYFLVKPGQTYKTTLSKSDRCRIKVNKKEISEASFTPSGKQKIDIYDGKRNRGVTLFVKPAGGT